MIETYQQALDYLYSFIDYSLQRTFTYSPAVFDLSRIHDILTLLGDPHRKYHVLHVAGTKGKGSVSALTASVCRAAGYRTALYTSPHLTDFCERMQIDGVPVAHDRLTELVRGVVPFAGQVPGITTFELSTALAFLYFAEEGADVAVVEVGLGGRLDATNVVDPLISVITSLSFDHTKILGNTLAEIAREKAGIVKEGVPFVSAPQVGEAMKVLEHVERERHAPMILIGRDWHFAPHRRSLDGQSFSIWPAQDQAVIDGLLAAGSELDWAPARYAIPLLGYHQVVNAATAYGVLRAASDRGLPVSEEAIHEGFRSVQWQGRFQLLHREPFVVVDAAHNRDSARRLRTALDDYFPMRRVLLMFGASDDKDIGGILDELLPRVSRMIATRSSHPRAEEPERLAASARERGCAADVVPDPRQALQTALRAAGPQDVVLAAGSVFLAAAVLDEWPQARECIQKKPDTPVSMERHSPPTEGIEYEWTRHT